MSIRDQLKDSAILLLVMVLAFPPMFLAADYLRSF